MTSLEDLKIVDGKNSGRKLSIYSHSVIIEDEKVLLVTGYRNNNFWTFPGEVCRDDVVTIASATTLGLNRQLGLSNRFFEHMGVPFVYSHEESGKMELFFHYRVSRYSLQRIRPRVEGFGWHDIVNLPQPTTPNVIHALEHFGYHSREVSFAYD